MVENTTVTFESGTPLPNVIEKLNELGKENWELGGIFKNGSNEIIFFLKRRTVEKIGTE